MGTGGDHGNSAEKLQKHHGEITKASRRRTPTRPRYTFTDTGEHDRRVTFCDYRGEEGTADPQHEPVHHSDVITRHRWTFLLNLTEHRSRSLTNTDLEIDLPIYPSAITRYPLVYHILSF